MVYKRERNKEYDIIISNVSHMYAMCYTDDLFLPEKHCSEIDNFSATFIKENIVIRYI